MAWIWTAVATTAIGFICQFLGLRACHSSVAVVQLVVTLAMSFVRAGLRTQRLRPEDNFLANNPEFIPGHELDYLALTLSISRGPNSGPKELSTYGTPVHPVWMVTNHPPSASSSIDGAVDPSCKNAASESSIDQIGNGHVLQSLQIISDNVQMLCGFTIQSSQSSGKELADTAEEKVQDWIFNKHCIGPRTDDRGERDINAAIKAVLYRSRLAHLTGLEQTRSDLSSLWGAQFVPVRKVSDVLALAIEDTMQILFASDEREPVVLRPSWEQAFRILWSLQYSYLDSSSVSVPEPDEAFQMSLSRGIDETGMPQGRWKANRSEIEAVLGLWTLGLKALHEKQGVQSTDTDHFSFCRILSAHHREQNISDDLREFSIWRPKNSKTKIEKRRLKITTADLVKIEASEPGSNTQTYHHLQNAIWWKEGEEYWATRGWLPRDATNTQQFLGWCNATRGLSSSDGLNVLGIACEGSLMQNCAQEIYSKFLAAMTHAVDNFGPSTDASCGTELRAYNINLTRIQDVLKNRGLCDEEAAFACTVPIIIQKSKLRLPHSTWSAAGSLAKTDLARKENLADFTGFVSWRLRRSFEQLSIEPEAQTEGWMRAMNGFRLSLLETCETYHNMLHENWANTGYKGTLELLEEYYAREIIRKTPLIWDDGGIVPEGLRDSRHQFNLADVIRCYGECALAYLDAKPSPDTEEQLFQSQLQKYCPKKKIAISITQAIQDGDLSSTLYLLHRKDITEPFKTQSLLSASRIGWIMVVKTLIDLGAAINQVDSEERSALSYVSELGDINVATTLIENGAILKEPFDFDKRPLPTHYAAKQGHAEIMRLIIKKWSGFSSIDRVDNKGMTPLSWAITSESSSIVQLLLEHRVCDPNHYHTEKAALHWAIRERKPEMVNVLLRDEHVRPNHADGNNIDRPPLVYALQQREEVIFYKLLESSRVEADTPDRNGRTALWWAAALGLSDYVKGLLQSGKVRFPDRTNKFSETPLSMAVKLGHIEVVKELSKSNPNAGVRLIWILSAVMGGFITIKEQNLRRLTTNKDQLRLIKESLDRAKDQHSSEDNKIWLETNIDNKIDTVLDLSTVHWLESNSNESHKVHFSPLF
jgi:ankyrin repeat protein